MSMAVTHVLLGQTRRGGGASIVWPSLLLGVGTAAAIGLALGIRAYRNRGLDDTTGARTNWTLQDLREMHVKGQLTDDEYERLKAAAGASVSAAGSSGAGASVSPRREHPG